MIPVLLLVVLISVFNKTIGLFAKEKIINFLWSIYLWIAPSSTAKSLKTARRRAEQVREERSNTSAKEEFARWAKLDRELLKLQSEIDQYQKQLGAAKYSFGTIVKIALFLLTTGSKVLLRIRYRKTPVFWLPAAGNGPLVLPYYVLWLLSFTSAPIGSVSVGIWLFIVDNSVSTIFSIFKSIREIMQLPQPVKAPGKTQ
ncbi:hypothetical protein DV451_003111 [Geotrichum candidum]|uniref:Golgi to ER traffic protein 1 n=1 Tax=Geotrichum candidum TaxID=1173061 RepID=A0A9P5G4Y3_GEOCN|nr:hypothetical protein DV451_003111 [Geotrichum candidum]KAI9212164.1 hypothetical protein DS838_002957 [Geotrichum bryndzae]KAF5108965.1 hypothetical protein DV453_001906 [Geotrichum candidum]KAF5113694.1 hypothetical protein DV454_003405 [Geotrichum candidum]KAF5118404.1 hypothetical protein DV452_002040 [Geotrichum candidum]